MNTNGRSAGLFTFSQPLDPFSLTFFINRLQTQFYILYLPKVLPDPAMIGVILLASICSHINIILISNYFKTGEISADNLVPVRSFRRLAVKLTALAGLGVILVKSIVLTMGYVGIIHHILFPSVNQMLFAAILLSASLYLARLGMEKTIQFAMIAFIGTIWVIIFYVPFAFPPNANYGYLQPLLPGEIPLHLWQIFFTVWASFAGPEYLLALPKRAVDPKQLKKALMIANAITAIEYIFFFCICLMFYGPEFLSRQDIPIIDLIRYIELPFVERLEMVLMTVYALSVVFVIAVLLLYAAGSLRLFIGTSRPQFDRLWLWLAFAILFLLTLVADRWIWADEPKAKQWIAWHSWIDSLTFAALPITLFLIRLLLLRNKWGSRHADS
jgi:hypothetical protein